MKYQSFAFLFLVVCVSSCSATDDMTNVVLTLGPNLTDCTGSYQMKCLVVEKSSNQKEVSEGLFYSSIEGFTFTPGQRQTVEVRVEPIENPPADGSDRKFIFIRSL